MNLRFWKKNATPRSSIAIFTKQQTLRFANSDIKSTSFYDPWRGFLKWYFARPQSTGFMMEYKNGVRLIPRKEILGFEIMKV